MGTTKPLEIAVPADQQARRKYITSTVNRELQERETQIIEGLVWGHRQIRQSTFLCFRRRTRAAVTECENNGTCAIQRDSAHLHLHEANSIIHLFLQGNAHKGF